MEQMRPLTLKQVVVEDRFWSEKQKRMLDFVLPYQWDILNDALPGVEPTHTVRHFRMAAGEMEPEGEYVGMFFQDSDLYKWLEAASYALAIRPDDSLRARAEEAIRLIGKAQQPDGYLNTYIQLQKPELRWKNLWRLHELYCAGHLIEAMVAYTEATGDPRALEIAERFADHIDSVFGPQPGKKRGYCGHPEIELALVRLYRATGKTKYLQLSRYFVEERGRSPHYFNQEAVERGDPPKPVEEYDYCQAHKPVLEQTKAHGHAVRAVYLYSALADLALECKDEKMLEASRRFWDNVTNRRMYVTGGIGSSAYRESFTVDYDLPNERAYAETCASIGLVFWASRMLSLEADRRYADVMELALHNGILSGISLDGSRYFYVNPLEVWPETASRREDMKSVKTERQPWFGCACCPPNIARLFTSLGRYIYGENPERKELYVHLYIGSTAKLLWNPPVEIRQQTGYPLDGRIAFTVHAPSETEFTLALRIPGWCGHAELAVNGEPADVPGRTERGYCKIRRVWHDGDRVELRLDMPVRRVRSRPDVRANAGCVALMRGPLVYCLEEADNGPNLKSLVLPKNAPLRLSNDLYLPDGIPAVEADGFRTDASPFGENLYSDAEPVQTPCTIRAVPYYLWGNRKPGEMLVWIREH